MAHGQNFTLKSKELGGQATQRQFANVFGCHGDNLSPQLFWENVPEGTKAFAVTMYDKDAPTGSGFWHWVVFNLPANVRELPSGAGTPGSPLLPAGAVHVRNDAGIPGYMGPCPPPGPFHQYLITVYALKAPLELGADTSPAVVGFMMRNAILAQASLVMYGQQ